MKADRTGWGALLASTLVLASLQIWLRPLLPVDETRYLSVAWEMWWRGDFLVPYLNGEPYSHKPPLLFWLVHGVWAMFGVSELAARLIPLLLSVLAMWMSANLAGRLWPRQRGLVQPLVPWLLLGSLFWHNFFTLVQFDMLLVLSALLAWFGVLDVLRKPARGWLLVAAGIGLGVLSKGPVILIPVMSAVLFAPWWARDSKPASWPAWYVGGLLALLLGAGIALAWAIPAGMAGGEAYRQAIFWGQSAGRMVNSFAHGNPWWSYLLWLPLMWLPWVIWPQLWRLARQAGLRDDGIRFCLAVIVPAVLIFSLISGKQGKYLLPLLPLIGLLAARWLSVEGDESTDYRLNFAGVLLILSGLVLLIVHWWPAGPEWLSGSQVMWGPALMVWAVPFFRLRLTRIAAVRAAALGMLLGTATVYLALVSLLAPQYNLRPLSQVLAGMQTSGKSLAWLGKYHAQFHFHGRLKERIEPLADRSELQNWMRANPDGYLLVNYKTAQPDVPATLTVQPYRGGSLVLWPAAQLLRDTGRLDALTGNA